MQRIRLKTDQNHPLIREYRAAMERGMKSLHVMPEDNRWLVKSPGPDKEAKTFDTLKEAKSYAREHARHNSSSVFIHDEDFRLRERIDY